MMDQDQALALLRVADETGARLTLVGDTMQLNAVGRGGGCLIVCVWDHLIERKRSW